MAHSPCLAGTCLRLYSESFYEQRLPPSPAPHVSETSLSRLVLLLKRLDIADMGQCDFLDRPGSAQQAKHGTGWARVGGNWRLVMAVPGGAGGSCGCRGWMGRAAWSWQLADVLLQLPSH